MIRTLAAGLFYAAMIPLGALVFFPWTLLTGKIDVLYRFGMNVTRAGVRIAGVRVETRGLDRLDLGRNYIFMANHASNADPPILIPALPRRTSVLVKKELFRIPLLGRAMLMASLVPIDRRNKEAAIASVRKAADVIRSGLDMTVFPEGTRTRDGRLLPFKKGPFHMAMETGTPIVPVTILGTYEIQPKGRLRVAPGTVTLVFHEPVDPRDVADRDALIARVRAAITSALPEERR